MSEIVPLSYNAHEELYGGGIEAFTVYSLKYLIQQQRSKLTEKQVAGYENIVSGQ